MVTIYDIAKKARCSAMTVSRVINNSGRVSEQTRKRILAIMEEMQYVPNTLARGLVLQETKILSLLIPDITNPFYTSLVRGAEDAAHQAGYKLLLANSDESTEKENVYIDAVLSTKADGVLFAPVSDKSIHDVNRLHRHGIPTVLLDREVPGAACDMVMGDSKSGARELTQHLIELGHRRIALLNGPESVSTARLRKEGYLEALKLSGIACKPEYTLSADFKGADVAEWLERLIRLEQPPTALFAANNFLAFSAVKTLQSKALIVPDDMSVVCFDELESGYVVAPVMTVASQPAYEFGHLGTQFLVERLQGLASPETRKIILPPKLIIRKSAAPLL